jgi:hypothetical protein
MKRRVSKKGTKKAHVKKGGRKSHSKKLAIKA